MTANILVVDDLYANLYILKTKLLSKYYTVFTARDGIEALDILLNHKIDIVLLDVMMPRLDGFTTCKKIKATAEITHIPIIMITALSDIKDRIKGLEAGADEFLTKPINDIALFARVRSLIHMKAAIDELHLRNSSHIELGHTPLIIDNTFYDSKILIIDDDIIQVKNITKYLLPITEQIKVLYSYSEKDILGSFIPNLIIINYQIDNQDPFRIIAMIRSKPIFKHVIIMLLTEEENVDLIIRAMDLGVNDYFIYPIDQSELQARVKTQLRKQKYQNNLRAKVVESINLSSRDSLTGLFNRRYFDTHIKQMSKKANENNEPFILLMIDIDNFKLVNDIYGHLSGDKLLKQISDVLKQSVHITDLVARYGGEEFALLIKTNKVDIAYSIAEKIRINIASMRLTMLTNKIIPPQTISIGLSIYKINEDISTLINRTDKALYSAKQTGKNKIVTNIE